MKFARRILEAGGYLFSELEAIKLEKEKKGEKVVDLSVGDPDIPPPPEAVEALERALKMDGFHRYPPGRGTLKARKAICEYYGRRFGVKLSPETEAVVLIGSKEAIPNLTAVLTDPGSWVIITDPTYPAYAKSARLYDVNVFRLRLSQQNGFLPNFGEIPESVLEKTGVLWLNFPNNPTSSRATRDVFVDAVKIAKKYDFAIVHDAAYVDVWTDGEPPISFLEVEGARDVGVELYSMSKPFSMQGFRVAFAVGNERVIGYLAKIKGMVDNGLFVAIQEAAAEALKHAEKHIKRVNAIYRRRIEVLKEAFSRVGKVFYSGATFYLWVEVGDSRGTALKLLERGVMVAPGEGFGEGGEGFIRVCATAKDEEIEEAARVVGELS